MVNITDTLISLTGRTSLLTAQNPYYAWSVAQVDSVCQAIKNLLINNVSAMSTVSSETNNYILSHSGLESGYAIRIFGSGAGTTANCSYVAICEGTWDGSTFTSEIYYKIYPFVRGTENYSSASSGSGYITWSWNYNYRLLVDDSGSSFVLRLAPNSAGNDVFAYNSVGVDFQYFMRNTGSSMNYYSYKTLIYGSYAPVIISLLPVNSKYYLTIMESKYQGNDASLGYTHICMMISQSNINRYNTNGAHGGSKNSDYNDVFYGWNIYNRDYVIASTMRPSTAETTYGAIKIVKLGVCDYGLPYIVDNTYLDNFFACSRNSNLVNGQIIVIDGYKYLYSDSGYLFGLGPATSGQTVTFSVYAGADDSDYGDARFKFDSAPSSNDDYDLYVAGGYSGDQPSVYGAIVPGGSESGVADGSQFTGSGQTLYCWGSDIYTTVTVGGTAISLGTYSNPTVIQLSGATAISVTPANFED